MRHFSYTTQLNGKTSVFRFGRLVRTFDSKADALQFIEDCHEADRLADRQESRHA